MYNAGLNYRDFTFIEDIVKIISDTINKKLKFNLYNICRSKPILTNNLVSLIKEKFKSKNIRFKKISFVKGEMFKTHGSNQN